MLTNFEIGRRIVEHEQKGEKRAEYGAELLKELSARSDGGVRKRVFEANLEYMRQFYLTWQDRDPRNCAEAFCAIRPTGKLVRRLLTN